MSKDIPDDIYTPQTQATGSVSKRVLIVTGEDVEDLEFYYPYYRLLEAGFAVDVVTPKGGKFKGKHGLPVADSGKVADAVPGDYDLLFVPGGKAPAKLRKDEDVLSLVRQFVATGKPVSTICHGPQILAAARVIDGLQIAAFPEVEDEIVEAGGFFRNEETVIDGQFLSARWPADLPALMNRTLEALGDSTFVGIGGTSEVQAKRPGAGGALS